jgi:outer membrane protein assembly factor BamB
MSLTRILFAHVTVPGVAVAGVLWALGVLSCRDGVGPAPVPPSGRVLWKVPSGASEGMPHEPAANADRSMAYFVTTQYRLRKIRGSDGRLIFDVRVGAQRSTPPGWNVVLSGGNAVVAKVDLFAFDTTFGLASWTYVAPDLDETGYSSIVADDSTVFAPSRTARLYAIDSRTGTARWILDLREGNPDVGAFHPTLADGTVYVCTLTYAGSLTGALWAIDATNGVVRWRYQFTPELPQQGSRCFGHPAVWRDLVIQPQEDGRVFAFERTTGTVRWIAPRVHDVTRSTGDKGYASAGDSIVIVTSQANEGMLVAYDPATGVERWRYTPNSGSMFPALIEGDVAYVDHGWIFASYDANTGALRWQTPQSVREPGTTLKGRPIVAGDRIYVAGRDGSYALKP